MPVKVNREEKKKINVKWGIGYRMSIYLYIYCKIHINKQTKKKVEKKKWKGYKVHMY